jgi:hypothetical protein
MAPMARDLIVFTLEFRVYRSKHNAHPAFTER